MTKKENIELLELMILKSNINDFTLISKVTDTPVKILFKNKINIYKYKTIFCPYCIYIISERFEFGKLSKIGRKLKRIIKILTMDKTQSNIYNELISIDKITAREYKLKKILKNI